MPSSDVVPWSTGRWWAGAVVTVVLAMAGCSSTPTVAPGPGRLSGDAVPVTVERGSIVTVVTADGVIAPTPQYVLWAAVEGAVTRMSGLKEGSKIVAGQAIARQGSRVLKAPVAGFFVRWLVPAGAVVKPKVPVVVLRYNGFGVAATLPPETAYRLYSAPLGARAQITNGPGPFDCPLLAVTGAGADRPSEPKVEVLCAIPGNVLAFAGLKAIIGVRTAERRNVLVLPVAAVTARSGQGQVWRLVDGKPVLTSVKVGITDGVNVEIVAGLAEGDQVLPYSPALRPEVR